MFTNNVIKKREEHLKIFWHIHLVSTLAKILKTGELKKKKSQKKKRKEKQSQSSVQKYKESHYFLSWN